jgi:hypothetical protein
MPIRRVGFHCGNDLPNYVKRLTGVGGHCSVKPLTVLGARQSKNIAVRGRFYLCSSFSHAIMTE